MSKENVYIGLGIVEGAGYLGGIAGAAKIIDVTTNSHYLDLVLPSVDPMQAAQMIAVLTVVSGAINLFRDHMSGSIYDQFLGSET